MTNERSWRHPDRLAQSHCVIPIYNLLRAIGNAFLHAQAAIPRWSCR